MSAGDVLIWALQVIGGATVMAGVGFGIAFTGLALYDWRQRRVRRKRRKGQ
jgi:hypothetical protein